MTLMPRFCWLAICPALTLASTAGVLAGSRVSIVVTEKATGKQMAARIYLRDSSGKPHQPAGLPFWRDHFVCGGEVSLDLRDGEYAIEVERGPEFTAHKGMLTAGSSAAAKVTTALDRLVDLAAEGWWSGTCTCTAHRRTPSC